MEEDFDANGNDAFGVETPTTATNETAAAAATADDDDFFGTAAAGAPETTNEPETTAATDGGNGFDDGGVFGDGNGGEHQVNEEEEADPNYVDPYRAIAQITEVPQVILDWQRKQEGLLAEKKEHAAAAEREIAAKAKEDLTKFFAEYESKKQATFKKNKDQQTAVIEHLRNPPTTGHTWERVTELCDLTQKNQKSLKDVSRIRSLFLQLKNTPTAPSA